MDIDVWYVIGYQQPTFLALICRRYNGGMLLKLKRTLAVVCLLATACFVILWMRSMKQVDSLILSGTVISTLEVQSSNGVVSFIRPDPDGPQVAEPGYHYFTGVSHGNGATPIFEMPAILAVNWGDIVQLPYWLLVIVNGFIGISLLLRRPFRFSLRTLAIATTATVVTLGLGVAASRLDLLLKTRSMRYEGLHSP